MQKLTKEQAVIISAYSGILCADSFGCVHEYIEKLLRRPVMTHELADKELNDRIKKLAKEDFLKICYYSDESEGGLGDE